MPTIDLLKNEDDRTLVEASNRRFHEAEKLHSQHRRKWEHFYRLYRSYTTFKRQRFQATTARDIDEIWSGARKEFGEMMFIPYVFATIETVLPRMLSQNPTMIVKPRKPDWEDNADNVEILLGIEQSAIDYPLITQDVGKDGLIYGLGVQKCWWETRKRSKIVLEPGTLNEYVQGKRAVTEFDGPMAAAVDPFDFLWDPLAAEIRDCRYAIHRSWRDDAYMVAMVAQGVWALPAGVDIDELKSGDGGGKRDEVWSERMNASGMNRPSSDVKGRVHEVWEIHDVDGLEVATIIDRWCPVQQGDFPYWHGKLPFQVYRPTKVTHEMVGIGEAEAIEELNEEMNELRTARRDNVRLTNQRPIAYWDGLIEVDDIVFAPGMMIPVDGDPNTVISPIALQPVDSSIFSEAETLKNDMQYVSGIDDSTAGAGASQETATGVQLVQAASNVRIQNKTLRLEVEVVKPTAEMWHELNQQKITKTQDVAGPPAAGEEDRKYSWYKIGPNALEGDFQFDIEGGSMAPDNPAQNWAEAQQLVMMTQAGAPIDQRKMWSYLLSKKLQIPQGETWIIPAEPTIPIHALETVRVALEQTAATGDQNAMLGLLNQQTFDQLVQGAALPPGSGEADQGGEPPAGGPQAVDQQQQVPPQNTSPEAPPLAA